MLLNVSMVQEMTSGLAAARIHEESEFRAPAILAKCDRVSQRAIVSRWTGESSEAREHHAEPAADYFTIGISMIESDVRLAQSSYRLYEGTLQEGTILLSMPGQALGIITKGSYDWIHIHVGAKLMQDCYGMFCCRDRSWPLLLKPDALFRDSVIYHLARGLLNLSGPRIAPYSLCAEPIILAIIARILGRSVPLSCSEAVRRTHSLIPWRLKRVESYIDAHLAEPMRLADLAQAAGLTRMHFAAQFRSATGLRPHEYVLRQRIERAKTLLIDSEMALVAIALAVGFQTQAHFTTVFRRFALTTPHQWRCRERHMRAPPQDGNRWSLRSPPADERYISAST
jgi:AraC family transcriptional regulator